MHGPLNVKFVNASWAVGRNRRNCLRLFVLLDRITEDGALESCEYVDTHTHSLTHTHTHTHSYTQSHSHTHTHTQTHTLTHTHSNTHTLTRHVLTVNFADNT
jgi:ABC-type nickel/cobalt efflux system permease component RcnA